MPDYELYQNLKFKKERRELALSNDIVLTEKQKQGLATAVSRYKQHKAYTCISGYA